MPRIARGQPLSFITGEVVYGSSTVPKESRRSGTVFSFNDSIPKKDSKEYKQLAGALKGGKERTEIMVQRCGGKAWDNFEAKLALRMLGQD